MLWRSFTSKAQQHPVVAELLRRTDLSPAQQAQAACEVLNACLVEEKQALRAQKGAHVASQLGAAWHEESLCLHHLQEVCSGASYRPNRRWRRSRDAG